MRTLRLILFLFLAALSGTASAVEVAFYSKDFASTFPHAYVRLTGITDPGGQPFDVNYGFTPVRVSPGILLGSVEGKMESVEPDYIARSDRHFALELTPEAYRRVIAVIERWQAIPQPSYRLNGRNCVDFVAEVARVIGLDAPVVPSLMKKPRSYLQMVGERNSALIAAWPGPPPRPHQQPAIASPSP